jgi:hypothetical protein
MARNIRTFTVERSLAEVFDGIADFSTAEQWDPGVRSSRPGAEGPRVGVGATWDLNVLMGAGIGLDFTYTTTGYDRPGRVVHATDTWFAHGEDVVTIAGTDGAVEVTWDASFAFKGPGRWFDALLQKGFEGVVERGARGLENWLRAGGNGHRPE